MFALLNRIFEGRERRRDMGSWNFTNIGIGIQEEKYKALGDELLTLLGYDLEEETHGSEVDAWYEADIVDIGCYTQGQLYGLFNTVFGATTIYYEEENGSNTSDYYYRLEKTYNPLTKEIEICETDYCYGDCSIFGEEFDYEEFQVMLDSGEATRCSTQSIPDNFEKGTLSWIGEIIYSIELRREKSPENEVCSKELYDLLKQARALAE